MPKINSRAKGAAGEREFCDWLQLTFKLEKKPQRNLEQVRSGGVDVICDPFAFEVKRQELIDHVKWWGQVTKAVKDIDNPAFGKFPVVAYRTNGRKQWEFLVPSKLILKTNDHGFIHLTQRVFVLFVNDFVNYESGLIDYEQKKLS